jgi:hypothetical protein
MVQSNCLRDLSKSSVIFPISCFTPTHTPHALLNRLLVSGTWCHLRNVCWCDVTAWALPCLGNRQGESMKVLKKMTKKWERKGFNQILTYISLSQVLLCFLCHLAAKVLENCWVRESGAGNTNSQAKARAPTQPSSVFHTVCTTDWQTFFVVSVPARLLHSQLLAGLAESLLLWLQLSLTDTSVNSSIIYLATCLGVLLLIISRHEAFL